MATPKRSEILGHPSIPSSGVPVYAQKPKPAGAKIERTADQGSFGPGTGEPAQAGRSRASLFEELRRRLLGNR